MGNPRGADARVVIGLALLLLGVGISVAAFRRAASAPAYFGAPEPGGGLGLLGGLLATAGLGLLAWWSVGAMARYQVREARGEIAVAVRDAQPALVCAGCGTHNAPGHKHCRECGARFA